MLFVWKLDRLGRSLAHLVNTVQDLSAGGLGLRVLAGQEAQPKGMSPGSGPACGVSTSDAQ